MKLRDKAGSHYSYHAYINPNVYQSMIVLYYVTPYVYYNIGNSRNNFERRSLKLATIVDKTMRTAIFCPPFPRNNFEGLINVSFHCASITANNNESGKWVNLAEFYEYKV